MNKNILCPLCGSRSSATIQSFSLSDLVKIWKRQLGFNPFTNTIDSTLEKHLCIECGLVHFHPSIIGDSSLYEKLSENKNYYPDNKFEFKKAIEIIHQHKPKSILEIGCGDGKFLSKVKNCANLVMGIDINVDALNIALKKELNVSNAKITDLSDSFDMIILFQVLEHLESPQDFLSKAIQKLNPGGILLIAVPNPEGFLKHIETHILDMPPHHATIWSKNALVYMLTYFNLEKLGYDVEPILFEHLRAQLFAQIESDNRMLKTVKFLQKITTLLLLPIIYMLHKPLDNYGQTHLIWAKKPAGLLT